MVWSNDFFFANLKSVHDRYRNFFESEDEDREIPEASEEDTPVMAPSESAARFYFETSFRLVNDDITKIDKLNSMNMYLCLNAASLLKDRIIREQEEIKKMEKQLKRPTGL